MESESEDLTGAGRIRDGLEELERRNFASERNYQVIINCGELYIVDIVSKERRMQNQFPSNTPTPTQIIRLQKSINKFVEEETKTRKITISNLVPFDSFPIQIPRLEQNHYISTIPEHRGYISLLNRLISEYRLN